MSHNEHKEHKPGKRIYTINPYALLGEATADAIKEDLIEVFISPKDQQFLGIPEPEKIYELTEDEKKGLYNTWCDNLRKVYSGLKKIGTGIEKQLFGKEDEEIASKLSSVTGIYQYLTQVVAKNSIAADGGGQQLNELYLFFENAPKKASVTNNKEDRQAFRDLLILIETIRSRLSGSTDKLSDNNPLQETIYSTKFLTRDGGEEQISTFLNYIFTVYREFLNLEDAIEIDETLRKKASSFAAVTERHKLFVYFYFYSIYKLFYQIISSGAKQDLLGVTIKWGTLFIEFMGQTIDLLKEKENFLLQKKQEQIDITNERGHLEIIKKAFQKLAIASLPTIQISDEKRVYTIFELLLQTGDEGIYGNIVNSILRNKESESYGLHHLGTNLVQYIKGEGSSNNFQGEKFITGQMREVVGFLKESGDWNSELGEEREKDSYSSVSKELPIPSVLPSKKKEPKNKNEKPSILHTNVGELAKTMSQIPITPEDIKRFLTQPVQFGLKKTPKNSSTQSSDSVVSSQSHSTSTFTITNREKNPEILFNPATIFNSIGHHFSRYKIVIQDLVRYYAEKHSYSDTEKQEFIYSLWGLLYCPYKKPIEEVLSTLNNHQPFTAEEKSLHEGVFIAHHTLKIIVQQSIGVQMTHYFNSFRQKTDLAFEDKSKKGGTVGINIKEKPALEIIKELNQKNEKTKGMLSGEDLVSKHNEKAIKKMAQTTITSLKKKMIPDNNEEEVTSYTRASLLRDVRLMLNTIDKTSDKLKISMSHGVGFFHRDRFLCTYLYYVSEVLEVDSCFTIEQAKKSLTNTTDIESIFIENPNIAIFIAILYEIIAQPKETLHGRKEKVSSWKRREPILMALMLAPDRISEISFADGNSNSSISLPELYLHFIDNSLTKRFNNNPVAEKQKMGTLTPGKIRRLVMDKYGLKVTPSH